MLYQKTLDAMVQALKQLEMINRTVSKRLKDAPEGSLHVSLDGKFMRFRVRMKGTSEKYISTKNKVLIRRLSQKSYDKKLYRKLQNNIKALNKAVSKLMDNDMDEVFHSMPEGEKPFVQQYEMTDEEYAAKWLEVKWERKNDRYLGLYVTDNGEHVRSKIEMIIANTLKSMGIPYRYEYPYKMLKADGSGYVIVYPDFTVLNKRTRKEYVIEHVGMLDNPEYSLKFAMKMSTYFANGWYSGSPLIFTTETADCPLNMVQFRKMAKEILL